MVTELLNMPISVSQSVTMISARDVNLAHLRVDFQAFLILRKIFPPNVKLGKRFSDRFVCLLLLSVGGLGW